MRAKRKGVGRAKLRTADLSLHSESVPRSMLIAGTLDPKGTTDISRQPKGPLALKKADTS